MNSSSSNASTHPYSPSHEESCPCKSSSLRLSVWSAAQYGVLWRLKELVARDPASVSKVDEFGHTPLLFAAQNGKDDCVEYLLGCAGVTADFSPCGATPLHRSAAGGHARCCSLLLLSGSNPNTLDTSTGDLRTPAMKAAAGGHFDLMRQLLEAEGADRGLKDARGMTAEDIARGLEHGEQGQSVRHGQQIEVEKEEAIAATTSTAATKLPSSSSTSSVTLGAPCSMCSSHVMVLQRPFPCGCRMCEGCVRRVMRRGGVAGAAAKTCGGASCPQRVE